MGMSQGVWASTRCHVSFSFFLFFVNSSFFPELYYFPADLSPNWAFPFQPEPAFIPHAPTLTRWPPVILPQAESCRSNSEFGVLHPRNPLSPARAASLQAPPWLEDQWEGRDAGTRPAIGWLGRGERWCGARSPPGCEQWAVVRATVRDVGRQAEQPPDDWLGDRTILPYWRPAGGPVRA